MAKSIFVLVFIFLTVASLAGQEKADSLKGNSFLPIAIKETVKDLGTLIKGEKAVYRFELINKSDKPLVIWHVSASCGCTTPTWTKKPVSINESAFVKVKFEAEDTGIFQKSIHVYTNFSEKPTKLLIKGIVVESKSTNAFHKKESNFNNQITK